MKPVSDELTHAAVDSAGSIQVLELKQLAILSRPVPAKAKSMHSAKAEKEEKE